MPSSAGATITATWNFKEKNPAGIENVSIQGTTGYVASSEDGVSLFVNATSGKFAASYSGLTYLEYCQINVGTIIHIPVVSTKDVITLNNYYVGADYTLGGENNATSHTATQAEVATGYVVLNVVSGTGSLYITSITAILAYMPVARTIAKWDWKNTIPASISSVSHEQYSGDPIAVASNVSGISMDFVYGKLVANGDNAQFNNGTILRVPVTSTSDVVTVFLYPGESYDVTVGAALTKYTVQLITYQATPADVSLGYVQITQGESQMQYLYSVTLDKCNHTTTTIGATGWATFSNKSATDFTSLVGVVDAYQVTGFTGTAINKSSVTTVAAEKGLLLNAAAGTYAIPLTDSGDALSGNQLVAQTAAGTVSASADDKYRNYVLVAPGGTVAFKSITGTNTASIGAGKAYLHLDISGGAPSANFLYFDDETTGVNAVEGQLEESRGDFFDLQGRKVAQPTKGLYIVNGKKVIIK